MTKLLIVDDEPLIQVGLKSMLAWPDYQIELCAAASNGQQALELIEKEKPDIVLADIKMPIMDGLELMKRSKALYGRFPLFIILTSHEDFHLLKESMNYEVVDYLIKLELTPEVLLGSIQKAMKIITDSQEQTQQTAAKDYPFYYDKLFISLLYNLFESPEQLEQLAQYVKFDLTTAYYAVCQCTFAVSPDSLIAKSPTDSNTEARLQLYQSSLQMLGELLSKYLPVHLFSLGLNYFCILFELDEAHASGYIPLVREALKTSFSMLHNYFNVEIHSTVGELSAGPFHISEAYEQARQIHSQSAHTLEPIFYEDMRSSSAHAPQTFNMSLFKEDLMKAFENYDAITLDHILTEIIELFKEHPTKYLQGMDAACNILYLTLSLLPDSEMLLQEIFSSDKDGYQSIYGQTSLDQVLLWLEHLRDGLCSHLSSLGKSHKHKLVEQVKVYIEDHITEKLSLQEVATAFQITPNYLSLLFKKHAEQGFSEYISQRKISYAKTLLDEGKLKIYEIADALGFESAFYFSKVFKKVEGCSPRDYKQYQ